MSTELSGAEKTVFEHVAGIHWPEADEDKLRVDAAAWRQMAAALRAVQADADPAARSVAAGNSGQAVERFIAFWDSKYVGGKGAFPTLVTGCEQMAGALEKYADAVADAKRKIVEQVRLAEASLVVGTVLAVVTLGASEAAAAAAADALVAFTARVVGVELVAAAEAAITTVLTGVFSGVMTSVGTDLVVQAVRVEGFHDGGFDWGELEEATSGGALAGAAGGVLGLGMTKAFTGVTELSAARPALAGTLDRLPTVLDSKVGRFATGAAFGGLSTQLATGHATPLDYIAGGLGGLATGRTLPEPWRARVERGIAFNHARAGDYPVNELRLTNNKILDSYAPGELIVSRKYTQLSEVNPGTASAYIRELATKYPPGKIIADTPRNRELYGDLVGEQLDGQMVLEVPVQAEPVPHQVLEVADRYDVIIRDVQGHVYSLPEGP